MTIYAAATHKHHVTPAGTVYDVTSYKGPNCAGSIDVRGLVANKATVKLVGGSPTTCWMGCWLRLENQSNGMAMITWADGATEFARIYYKNTTDDFVFQTKTTSTWTDVQILGDLSISIIMGSAQKLVFKLVVHDTTGEIAVWYNGLEQANYTGLDTTGDETVTGVTDIILQAPYANSGVESNWSEIIVADEDTRDMVMEPIQVNAAGTTSDFTGAYTDIDWTVGADPDTEHIHTGAANDISTFAADNLAASTREPLAVIVQARARSEGGGPTNLQHAVRTNAVDYFSANLALSAGFTEMAQTIWHNNPNTAVPWTVAEVDAVEIGVKAIA